jgi:hypothetical protein
MSDRTTIDEASKLRIRDALLVHARHELGALSDQVEDEHAAAELDQDTSLEVDDTSQSYEAGDLHALYGRSVARQSASVRHIESLDFAHTDVVVAGAIVGVDGRRYVVGVASAPFECDGVTYEGIASDSPIFTHIQGLRVGDTFEFMGQKQHIVFVA